LEGRLERIEALGQRLKGQALTDLPIPPLPAGPLVPVGRLSRWTRVVNLVAVVVPFAGLLAAAVLWGWGFSWLQLSLLLAMYFMTGLGITVGYHRQFCHRSFGTTPVVRFTLAALGSMAVQGPPLRWVALHRRHHQHADESDDPHSPHHRGPGIPGVLRGLCHAHLNNSA
jgi:stearoyl-CoA desaturase (delta-9 desaturase)